jgi:hypothetical protein
LDPNARISDGVPIALVNKAQLPHSAFAVTRDVLTLTSDHQYFRLGPQFEKPLIAAASGSEDDLLATKR